MKRVKQIWRLERSTGVTPRHNEKIRRSYSWSHIIVLFLICSSSGQTEKERERGDITGNDKGAGGSTKCMAKKKEPGWIEEEKAVVS